MGWKVVMESCCGDGVEQLRMDSCGELTGRTAAVERWWKAVVVLCVLVVVKW